MKEDRLEEGDLVRPLPIINRATNQIVGVADLLESGGAARIRAFRDCSVGTGCYIFFRDDNGVEYESDLEAYTTIDEPLMLAAAAGSMP